MNDRRPIPATRQGRSTNDNQSLRSIGKRSPATPENRHFTEKITHFGQERIPERVVHACRTGAHGYSQTYGKIGDEPDPKHTCAKVLKEVGVDTPILVRFPTVTYPLQAHGTKFDVCDGSGLDGCDAGRAVEGEHAAVQIPAFMRRQREP